MGASCFLSSIWINILIFAAALTQGQPCCNPACLEPKPQIGGCAEDLECEAIICDIDQYCCNVEWDPDCVSKANTTCTSKVNTVDPTFRPTDLPTTDPTMQVTDFPTFDPTINPTQQPDTTTTTTLQPTPMIISCDDSVLSDFWRQETITIKVMASPSVSDIVLDTCSDITSFDTTLELFDSTEQNLLFEDDDGCGDDVGRSRLSFNSDDDFYILRLGNKEAQPSEGRWQLEMYCDGQSAVPTMEPTMEPSVSPSAPSDDICCQCTCPWHGRGCKYRNNEACEDIICGMDSYCCWHAWDNVCAIKAKAICENKPLPKCCACTDGGSFERGCEQDLVCEEEICEMEAYCCGSDCHGHGFWDDKCIHMAANICQREADEYDHHHHGHMMHDSE